MSSGSLDWVRPLLLDGEYFGIAGASESIYVRFWSKVDQSAGLDACWPWTGAKANSRNRGARKVGIFRLGGVGSPLCNAARVALALASDGQLHRALHACHASQACSDADCCNPQHLRWGTPSENELDKQRDMEAQRVAYDDSTVPF